MSDFPTPDAEPRDAFAMRNRLRRFQAQLKRRWWLALLAVALCTFAGGFWASRQPPAFLSTARMVVSGKISVPEGATYSEELTNFFGTQAELMHSDEVMRRAQERVASMNPEIPPAPVALNVGRIPNASIFTLSAIGPNAAYTQKMLEAAMAEYTALKKQMRSEISDDTQAAITQQLNQLDGEIRDGQDKLIEFQKNNNVGFLQEQGNSAAEYLVTLNRNLADLKNEYQLLQSLDLDPNLDKAQKHQLMTMTQQDRADATASKSGQAGIDQAQKEAATADATGSQEDTDRALRDLQSLTAQRDDFAKVLRPQHPTMIGLNDKIAEQKRLIETLKTQGLDELKTRRESLRLEIENLEKTIAEWEGKALDVGKRMADYQRIKDKVDRDQEVYHQQQTNLQNISVNKNVDQDLVSVLEHASPPVPVQVPLWKAMAVSAVAGLMLAAGLLLLLARLDDRILSTSDLEQTFKARALAQIPRVGAPARPRTGNGKASLALLTENDERHAFAESLRSLRSSLVFLPMEGATPRSLLITSGVPDEGKSTVAANLAVTFAFAGARVLLIDGDLRRGQLHEQFGLRNEHGFGDALAQERTLQWRNIVQQTMTPGLGLLSRGKAIHHPGERFLGRGTNRLLGEMYSFYDYVIIDSAPVMVADDTTTFAPKIDATLFVVRYGVSSIRTSRKALELLRDRQANVLGIVCNDVALSAQEYYYYRYPEYHGTPAEAEAS